MLPNFKTAQEKMAFANTLFDIFMGQESIKNYYEASSEEREAQRAMYSAELESHFETEEIGPADGIVALTVKCEGIMENLKNLTSGNLNNEAFEKNWDNLNNLLESANNENDPFKPVNDYLDKYGMKKLNNPIIKLHMDMAQAISNSVNYSLLTTNPFNAENDKRYNEIIREHQKVIDETSEEMSQFCVENKIEAESVYSSYNSVLGFMNNLKEDIRETLEKSKKLDSESAKKITDYLVAEDRLTKVQKDLNEIRPKMDLTLVERLRTAAQVAIDYEEMYEGDDSLKTAKGNAQYLDKKIADQEKVVNEHEGWIRNFEREMPAEQIKAYCAQNDAAVKLKSALKTFDKFSRNDKLNQLLQDVKDDKDLSGLSAEDRKMLTDYETAKDSIKDAYINSETKHTEDLEDFFERLENPKEHANVCKEICKNKDNPIYHRINSLNETMNAMEDKHPHLKQYVQERRELNTAKIKLQKLNDDKKRYEDQVSQHSEHKKQSKDAVVNYRYLAAQTMKQFGLISDLEMPKYDDVDPKNCERIAKVVSQTQKELLPKYNSLLADEKETTAALDAAKKGLKGVQLPKDLAKDIGEKIKEVNRNGDRFRTLSTCVQKADKIVNAIENKSVAESGKRYDSKIKVETQRRESISNTLKGYMQTHLSEGNAKKNSEAYNDLRKNLKEVANAFDVNSKLSNKERADKIADLRSAAEKYLQEKGKQWRPFPSEQRLSRLQGAENVLKFCNDLEKTVRNTPDISIDECKKNLGAMVDVKLAQEQMKKTVGKKVNEIKKAAEQAKMKKAPVQNKKDTVVSNMK